MSRRRKNKKTKGEQHKNKSTYQGPYQSNPNLGIQEVKKSMRPENEGPTVDTFSELDSTTNILPNEENDIRRLNAGKRPTKERKFIISTDSIILAIFGFVAIGIGIIVYTYSNKFVSVEKDIEYLQEDIVDQNEIVKEIRDKTIDIDKKVDLINQKIELIGNKNNR